MSKDKMFLSTKELAERWGLNAMTIFRMRKHKEGVKPFRVGRFYKYRITDVEKFEDEHSEKES